MATVLVTGANRGIGLEYTKQYLFAGYEVIATYRSPERMQALTALHADYESQLTLLNMDVTDDNAITVAAMAVTDKPIDILICNAGVYGPYSDVGESDTQGWLDTFHTNTIAPMHIVEAFLPNILKGNDRKIVLMTSKMGSMEDNGSGGSYIYRSSKAALNAVGKSLALDLQSENIVVLLMHPGWVQTDMTSPNAPMTPTASVTAMRKVIEQAALVNTGRFWAYDGKEIPW